MSKRALKEMAEKLSKTEKERKLREAARIAARYAGSGKGKSAPKKKESFLSKVKKRLGKVFPSSKYNKPNVATKKVQRGLKEAGVKKGEIKTDAEKRAKKKRRGK